MSESGETRSISVPLSALETLNREFLEIRSRLVQLAAALDRVDRAEGFVGSDPRLGQIRQALEMLHDAEPRRAERVQQLFSRPYDPQWRSALGVSTSNHASEA